MASLEQVVMTSTRSLLNGTQEEVDIVSDVPNDDDCVIFDVNVTVPWNNPSNLISWETEQVFDRIKSAIIIPVLYLIGVPANVVNMIVFFKQGLRERINLCLFALALVDLIYLTVVFSLYAESMITQLMGQWRRYGESYRYAVNHNVIGLYGFGYGPSLLAAVISTERCVCVLFPLKAQRCVPTKALALVLFLAVSLLAFARFAITAQYRLACFYESRTGRTSWRVYVNEYHHQNRAMLSVVDGVFYGFCVSVGCPVLVLVTTAVTAVKLTQVVRWRRHTAAASSSRSSVSSKEIGVTKMLISLSIEFLLLSIPIISIRVSPVFEPRISAGGFYANTFMTLLGLSELSSYLSSSVNFFVYYFTGSRYRETIHGLFSWTKKLSSKSTTQNKTIASEVSQMSRAPST